MSSWKKPRGSPYPTVPVGSYGPYSANGSRNNSSPHDSYQNSTNQPSGHIESSSPAQNDSQDYQHIVNQKRPVGLTEVEQQDTTAMEVPDGDQEPYSWRYTSSNGAKTLENISDAHQYVTRMSEIWQVPRTMEAEAFMNDLHQSIEDVKNTYCREYFLTDDKKMVIHLVVAIRNLRGHMREVYFCLQQLTDSSMGKKGADGTIIQMKPTVKWLRTKAAERLGGHANVLNISHPSQLGGHDGNTTGTDMQSTASFSICRPS